MAQQVSLHVCMSAQAFCPLHALSCLSSDQYSQFVTQTTDTINLSHKWQVLFRCCTNDWPDKPVIHMISAIDLLSISQSTRQFYRSVQCYKEHPTAHIMPRMRNTSYWILMNQQVKSCVCVGGGEGRGWGDATLKQRRQNFRGCLKCKHKKDTKKEKKRLWRIHFFLICRDNLLFTNIQ